MSGLRQLQGTFIASILTLTVGTAAVAEPKTFDFQDPKGVNGVVFVMDSVYEPIVGLIGGVAGEVTYDPADPSTFGGQISIDMATTSLVNSTMVEHLKSNQWLNITGPFPATMHFNRVTGVEKGEEGVALVSVEGVMSFGGQELPLEVDVLVTHFGDGAKARGAAEAGDLLVLRSEFDISRIGLGINPEAPTSNVGESIRVIVPIAGYSK